MKTKLLAMAASIVIASTSGQARANAANEVYVGLQYGYNILSIDVDGVPDFNPGTVVGRFGVFGTANFAIEGRVGAGVQDATETVGATEVKFELETLLGMYGVGHFNFGRNSSIYGVLGFTRVDAKLNVPSLPGWDFSGDDSDISYGVGADLGISKSIAVNIEYMSYLSKSGADINAANIGLVFGF